MSKMNVTHIIGDWDDFEIKINNSIAEIESQIDSETGNFYKCIIKDIKYAVYVDDGMYTGYTSIRYSALIMWEIE